MNRFQKLSFGARSILNAFLSQTTNGGKLAAFLAIAIASIFTLPTATAADGESVIEEVVVTGTRIKRPGHVSSSPIQSIDALEITLKQEVEIEKILRDLTSTIPGDGGNVNNGTAGAATIDLRGLGPERNLVLLNGRRITPFNHNGEVDTSTIPTALLERVDVVTGGASAVYGSDAIAGAVNLILKDDFRGLDLRINKSQTSQSDADVDNISLTLGAALEDGRGNIALNVSWAQRDALLLGQRDLGLLGISTASGSGLFEFNSGQPPLAPTVAGCDGPNVVDLTGSGSTTAIPTRVAIAGAGSVGQFLNDRTLYTANRSGCSRFNFNPFNYYRTPQERYNILSVANFEFNEHFEAYATFEYSNISVVQQVAPSGTFGAQFDVPLANPFFSTQALNEITTFANAAVVAGTLSAGGTGDNWNDVNGNGVVDVADYLKLQLRRRTLELGPRTEEYDNGHFMILVGAKGDIAADWKYDISFQYGESNRNTIRDGYTNLTNIQAALDTTSTTTCTNSNDANCVPIDLFGGFGTIEPNQRSFARAIALQQQEYEQTIGSLNFEGPIEVIRIPSASDALRLNVGYEKRIENAALTPDECLILAPASCQGGAGGNLLPISGGINVEEFYVEGVLPIASDLAAIQDLALEFAFRTSDYSEIGNNDTYKIGLNWRPVDSLLLRVTQQEATRAPNIGELISPQTRGLDNAVIDPCSVANVANIDAALTQLCIGTGQLAAQVGVTQDIVSGQVNTFVGTDPNNRPAPETANTFTAGVVWTPELSSGSSFSLTVDYYDIDIEDYISEFSAQQIIDQCYGAGVQFACDQVVRTNGTLSNPTSGITTLTRNLDFLRAEGIEASYNYAVDLPKSYGRLSLNGTLNYYLRNEQRAGSTLPTIDCKGRFGTTCDPIAETSYNQRATWNWDAVTVSLLWRYIGEINVEDPESAGTFAGFRNIEAYNYIDIYGSYAFLDDSIEVSASIENVTDRDAPVVGNSAGSTSFNGGNTFPSHYSVLGRVYKLGFTYRIE